MEESINLTANIFNASFFSSEPFVPRLSQYSKSLREDAFEVSGLFGNSFYIAGISGDAIKNIERFFKALDFNFKGLCIQGKHPSGPLEDIMYEIECRGYRVYLPLMLIKKLEAYFGNKSDTKAGHDDKISEKLDLDFIIKTHGFPYNIVRFLESYDNITIQKIINLLLSNNLCDEKMLLCLAVSSNDNRLLGNFPKNMANKIRQSLDNNEYNPGWIKNGLYQLKYNLGLISEEIDYKNLSDFKRIESYIFYSEINEHIAKEGHEKFLAAFEKKNILQKTLSLVDNRVLANIVKDESWEVLYDHFSKRRKLMIEEEGDFLKEYDHFTYLKNISILFDTALNMEYGLLDKKTERLRNYLINLSSEKDFRIIYSRLNPIDFALCFKPLSKKVQNYVLSKLDAISASYLSDIFTGKIRPISGINKGWLEKSREKFLYTCYKLEKLGRIELK